MPVDSHITMPASIMRGFFIKGKTKETYSFNIKTNSIDEVVIKEHGTEHGYYSDETENALAKSETTFGEIKKKIVTMIKNCKCVELSENEERILYFFTTTLLSRNRTLAGDIQRQSLLCDLFGIKITPSDAINMTYEIYPNGEILNTYKLYFFINKSDENFICPENCLYSPLHNMDLFSNKPAIIFPITPKILLVFSTASLNNLQVIESNDLVDSLNKDALFSAYVNNSAFVVSASKATLEKLEKISSTDEFIKQVYIFQLFNKVEKMKTEEIHSGRCLSESEKNCLYYVYKNDVLPDNIKNKIEEGHLFNDLP